MASPPMELPTLEKSGVVASRGTFSRVLSSLRSASFLSHRHQGEGGPWIQQTPALEGLSDPVGENFIV